MAVDTLGGGFGSTPSNDPSEREGKPACPGVNSEGFDSKYTMDGASVWAAPGEAENLPEKL